MTWWQWALVVLGAWSAVSVVLGFGLGYLIGRGERQRMHGQIERYLSAAAQVLGR
jgi:hypothetical protein